MDKGGLMDSKNYLEKVYLVGENFIDFCQNENVFTASKFLKEMTKSKLTVSQIIIGQGIDKTTLDKIQAETWKINTGHKIELIEKVTKRISKELVHKNKTANVMITHPKLIRRVGKKTTFSSSLVIDKYCAELTKHSGMTHIQCNILTEAARQFFMAVAEAFVVKELNAEPNSFSYAIQKIDINYSAPLEPLEVEMVLFYEILSLIKKRAKAEIRFVQVGDVRCKVNIFAQAFPRVLLNKIEKRQASQYFRNLNG